MTINMIQANLLSAVQTIPSEILNDQYSLGYVFGVFIMCALFFLIFVSGIFLYLLFNHSLSFNNITTKQSEWEWVQQQLVMNEPELKPKKKKKNN